MGRVRLCRGAVLLAVLVLSICCMGASYTSNCAVNAAALRQFAFPRSIHSIGQSKALEFRAGGYSFTSLEEINKFNIHSQDFVPNSEHQLHLRYAPIESSYWSEIVIQDGANRFIDALARALEDSRAAECTASWRNLLEKALLQRDLYQLFSLVIRASENADDSHRSKAQSGAAVLAKLIRATLFSDPELATVHELLAKSSFDEFTPDLTFDLRKNYLPRAAMFNDAAWITIENRGLPFRHFVHYRGRSFVRVKGSSTGH